MIDSVGETASEWLPLREASKKMGVSPQTLRVWADAGRVPTYRTPGGHRRFRVGTLALPERGSAPRTETRWRVLEHSAFGRMRLLLEEQGDRDPGTERLSAQARGEHRALGRELIRLLVRALQREQHDYSARAEELGQAYALLHRRFRISNREALRSLAFFRSAFLESVVEFAFGVNEQPGADQLSAWLRRANQVIDAVCISMFEAKAKVE